MKGTPVRYMPMGHTPMKCIYIPVKCTPVKYPLSYPEVTRGVGSTGDDEWILQRCSRTNQLASDDEVD